MDKTSRLSLNEDSPADNPIIANLPSDYLIGDKIVVKTREVIVS